MPATALVRTREARVWPPGFESGRAGTRWARAHASPIAPLPFRDHVAIARATTTMELFSAEDIVEEMPVVDALRAFLAYLDLTDANAMDAKLHRSGRHPDDLHWSSNPKYANKAKVAGRISSTDDSALFLKLTKERDMRAKQAAARKERLDAARVDVANGLVAGTETDETTSASRTDAALRSVFRAYGSYRRFKPQPAGPSFKAPLKGSYERADRPERKDAPPTPVRETSPSASDARFENDAATTKTSDSREKKNAETPLHPVQDDDGVFELDCVGWQKLVRDCAMLDNATTAVDLDDLFARVDAGEVGYDERNRDERRRRAATGAKLGDAKLEYAEFKVLLRECAKRRYVPRGPKRTENKGASQAGLDPAFLTKQKIARLDAAYAALLREDILPRARGGIRRAGDDDASLAKKTSARKKNPKRKTKRDEDLESLLGRTAMNAFRAHDTSLRRVYAHYATLEMYSASTKKITWRVVEETGATLNEDEFLCFLVNFDVVPHLASRDECLGVFREVELENDGDGNANEMAFPAFCETLGRLSCLAFQNAAPTLRNPRADVAAVRRFKKLVSFAPRDLWELGTLGGLLRERGFFTGRDGGTDLTKHRAARTKRIEQTVNHIDRDGFHNGSDWRYGPGSRAANYNRLGRASDVHDPEAYEHDLYVHAHANQWTREDANARSIENAKKKSEANLAKRAFVQPTPEKSSPRFLPSVPSRRGQKLAPSPRKQTFAPRGWVPSGVSDDVRSPGAGGLRAAYGYQQSPGNQMHWRVNEKREQRPAPRLRARVAQKLGVADPDPRYASFVLDRALFGPLEDADLSVFATLQSARLKHTSVVSSSTFDRLRADEEWESASRQTMNETTGKPWVPSSVPSYDRLRPERFNLTESFHASVKNASGPFSFAKQTHAPVKDAFGVPVERPVPIARRSVAFDPPVERPGYHDAVGGLVTSKRDAAAADDEHARFYPDDPDAENVSGFAPPTDMDPDELDAVDRAMRALEIETSDDDDAFEDEKSRNSLKKTTRAELLGEPRIPFIASPGSRTLLRSLEPTSSPSLASDSSHEKNKNKAKDALTDAVRIASPGTYAYGLGTSFARPGQVVDPGVAFSRRAAVDLDSFPSRRTARRGRRGEDFASLPHPAVAEVASLDWFEDVRSKALRQRGLPSTKFLSTWREKLGTKERRLRDEADVDAIKRGLRARLKATT